MLKVLITGGSGLLAVNWACCARDTCEVVLALHKKNVVLDGVKSVFVNLVSRDDILGVLNQISPDVVVHTAGLTNVDECQLNSQLAYHVNCELTANVAFACAKAGAKLVYISTDHLFSGQSPLSSEDSSTQPANIYAESKLCAEHEVTSLNPEALIIRTNFFGWGHQFRQSFSDWIYSNISNNKEITLFDDVYFTPILIDSLTTYIHELLALNVNGIFNVVSDERISKYAFGLLLCEKFGLSSHLIKRGNISSIKLLAPRPNDMSLSNKKLKQILGVGSVSVSNQLDLLKFQLENGRAKEIKNAIRES
jgi:dTDP-4-dehydrorhamnose reductase